MLIDARTRATSPTPAEREDETSDRYRLGNRRSPRSSSRPSLGTERRTTVSAYHCSCGFAIDDAEEFGDHLREVFGRDDETGTDGRVHTEITPEGQRQPLVCACGYRTGSGPDFDDHILLATIPPDGIGCDGKKHVPVDTSTPVRWFVPDNSDE